MNDKYKKNVRIVKNEPHGGVIFVEVQLDEIDDRFRISASHPRLGNQDIDGPSALFSIIVETIATIVPSLTPPPQSESKNFVDLLDEKAGIEKRLLEYKLAWDEHDVLKAASDLSCHINQHKTHDVYVWHCGDAHGVHLTYEGAFIAGSNFVLNKLDERAAQAKRGLDK